MKDISGRGPEAVPGGERVVGSCQLFVAKLNKLEKETGWVYRLPKEAEWEYACRGGPMADKAGQRLRLLLRQADEHLLPEQANFEHGKGLNRTCKVGSYEPNRLGLYDMHGNVWEWCDDAEDHPRVVRGGGCFRDVEQCRAGYRYGILPGRQLTDVGLRVVRVPSAAPSPETKTK